MSIVMFHVVWPSWPRAVALRPGSSSCGRLHGAPMRALPTPMRLQVGIATDARYSLSAALGDAVKASPRAQHSSLAQLPRRCCHLCLQVRTWIIAGLPNDSFSIENAIITVSGRQGSALSLHCTQISRIL